MIRFVNAKINIGLQIVARRPDGYHELQTIFYPVGKYAGTPRNPEAFCDILEVEELPELGDPSERSQFQGTGEFEVRFSGRPCGCAPEKNLVWRAAELYMRELATAGFRPSVHLWKNIPDGAGMGGGSADAAFTLLALRDLDTGCRADDRQLEQLALRLGADCPFFIRNTPSYAAGVGEILQPVTLPLKGWWAAVVKPALHISTAEAFAGVTPKAPAFDLRRLGEYPVEEWGELAHNDFEDSLFPRFPLLREVKDGLRECGALYSAMTGSGAALYGLFPDAERARRCAAEFRGKATIEGSYALEL